MQDSPLTEEIRATNLHQTAGVLSVRNTFLHVGDEEVASGSTSKSSGRRSTSLPPLKDAIEAARGAAKEVERAGLQQYFLHDMEFADDEPLPPEIVAAFLRKSSTWCAMVEEVNTELLFWRQLTQSALARASEGWESA
eukprot:CAMPEP_0169209212 /NCGR_PEP_ID=MMETSP1016-20121227/14547_1 /TAXON_ID=342587 /ORGANISM="Karlodinium micrum, Strain CCMP2283" /LENGTH=137 /DNA_ID=CAMNT_0009286643 /DNA_START=36 /DNA_END=445 /DNA_ORIENTATION=+